MCCLNICTYVRIGSVCIITTLPLNVIIIIIIIIIINCWVWRRRWCGTGLDCGGHSSAVCSQPVSHSQHYHPPSMEEKRDKQSSGQGDGRSTAAMRTRSCEGTSRSCKPAAMVPPSKQIKLYKCSYAHIHTYTNICKQNFRALSSYVDCNIQYTFNQRLATLLKGILIDIVFFNQRLVLIICDWPIFIFIVNMAHTIPYETISSGERPPLGGCVFLPTQEPCDLPTHIHTYISNESAIVNKLLMQRN